MSARFAKLTLVLFLPVSATLNVSSLSALISMSEFLRLVDPFVPCRDARDARDSRVIGSSLLMPLGSPKKSANVSVIAVV